jgi:hypothetical protein
MGEALSGFNGPLDFRADADARLQQERIAAIVAL